MSNRIVLEQKEVQNNTCERCFFYTQDRNCCYDGDCTRVIWVQVPDEPKNVTINIRHLVGHVICKDEMSFKEIENTVKERLTKVIEDVQKGGSNES